MTGYRRIMCRVFGCKSPGEYEVIDDEPYVGHASGPYCFEHAERGSRLSTVDVPANEDDVQHGH